MAAVRTRMESDRSPRRQLQEEDFGEHRHEIHAIMQMSLSPEAAHSSAQPLSFASP
jgi:hypothetical protein